MMNMQETVGETYALVCQGISDRGDAVFKLPNHKIVFCKGKKDAQEGAVFSVKITKIFERYSFGEVVA